MALSRLQPPAAQQVGEARVLAEGIERWSHFEVENQMARVLLIGLLQPYEYLLLILQDFCRLT